MVKILRNELETQRLGALIGAAHTPGASITLEGQIGSGKTTFARGFLQSLNYRGPVKSPTFTLIEYYEFESYDLFHIDLFRLNDVDELNYLGLDANSRNRTTYLIEWPKFELTFISKIDLNITFKVSDSGRVAVIEAHTQEGRRLVQALTV
ncbi:MAG: tRNA (adenosine(37)-N6)-threonylcarbamoyltransferase complex ATPase subunit type 1 TsaE [Methylococcaceae bacterium TMED69]|nr:MAG: tRNA (adenosine(37)-N6)-threonylcarbamoyltransferase complex ATPase subunit type 1 TsaE [Methylococcaceae bacterium TMED69]|tara:strand:+ start:170 stop:622 length:453 start_codon:yes stop_codon:yes gene_type:complete